MFVTPMTMITSDVTPVTSVIRGLGKMTDVYVSLP